MASIIVRGLDDRVKQQLASQAKEHGRSMEDEVRAILTKAALRPHIGLALLNVAQDVGGVERLPIPTATTGNMRCRSSSGFSVDRWEGHVRHICRDQATGGGMTNRTVLRPDGVSIAVTDLGGDGPVVVLLHGLAGSSRELLPTAQALPGYRVLLVDQRGTVRVHGFPMTCRAMPSSETSPLSSRSSSLGSARCSSGSRWEPIPRSSSRWRDQTWSKGS